MIARIFYKKRARMISDGTKYQLSFWLPTRQIKNIVLIKMRENSTQPALTCSKLTIKRLEQGVNDANVIASWVHLKRHE